MRSNHSKGQHLHCVCFTTVALQSQDVTVSSTTVLGRRVACFTLCYRGLFAHLSWLGDVMLPWHRSQHAGSSIPPTSPWGEGSDWQSLARACPMANPHAHPTSKTSDRTSAPTPLVKIDDDVGSPVCVLEMAGQG